MKTLAGNFEKAERGLKDGYRFIDVRAFTRPLEQQLWSQLGVFIWTGLWEAMVDDLDSDWRARQNKDTQRFVWHLFPEPTRAGAMAVLLPVGTR